MGSDLPRHIAIIMDGNGRWAKKRFLPRVAGHRAGVEAARGVIKLCIKHNIPVLTLFAFSSENWRRPPDEVSFLLDLLMKGLDRESTILHENNVRLRFIGERNRFTPLMQEKIRAAETLTQANSGLTLLIAADYGGQWDITQAAIALARQVEQGQLKSTDINSQTLARQLSFADLPDPDLFIRPSGELRISNFMLWQLAYAELYFTPTYWPDFNETEFAMALSHYAQRERRFGYSSEQLSEIAC